MDRATERATVCKKLVNLAIVITQHRANQTHNAKGKKCEIEAECLGALADAIRMLNARVYTAIEVEQLPQVAWLDLMDGRPTKPVLPLMYSRTNKGGMLTVQDGSISVPYDMNEYGKRCCWRLWDKEPSEEERKGAKWDD